MEKQVEHSASRDLASRVLKVYNAIEASADALFVTDNKGRIDYVNKGFLTLTGWTETEAIGRSVSDVPHSKNITLKMLQAMNQGRAWESRHQIRQKSSSEDATDRQVWVKTRLNPIEETPGEIIGFVGVLRDVTKDVTLELRLKKEMGEVMALAIRRAKDLKQSQADQAQALQEADTRSSFLASMSHEIRTPLNGVLGMTELLLNTQLSNKQQHLADIIHRSGVNLLDLINDILDLSKIEAGKLELHNEVQDLRLLIEDVADTFAERANSKGLELTCIFPSNLHALFECDRQRLTQILTNLTGNAIKFTDKGEVTLQASLLKEDGEDQILRFDVIDTGPGIPENKRGEIFESFSQIHSAQDQHTKGTGLGLAICKQLAEMMSGAIGVDSEIGKGSNFWFTARLRKAVREDHVDESNDESTALHDIKILVVDDNATSREALINQLKIWQVDAHGAESAIEAMNLLKRAHKEGTPFKLTMVDHDMPDVSGLNLARMLKENDIFANTPLVLLNSVNDLEETLVWTTAGVKAYLTKPVRQAELFNCLTGTLSIPVHKTEKQATLEQSRLAQTYNARVLVAEDNHVNQELVSMMLEEFGCEVTIADNGQIAVDKINQGDEYDLIFMDCMMPVMDGLKATQTIRSLAGDQLQINPAEIPIVALTANAMPDDRKQCVEAGMDDYMTKPFSRSKLSQALDQWLKAKQRRPSVSSVRPVETTEQFENTLPLSSESANSEPVSPKAVNDKPVEVKEARAKATTAKAKPPVEQKPTITKSSVETTSNQPPATVGETTLSPEAANRINPKTLDNIRSLQREGAPDILKKIVGLYLDNSKGLILEIEEAVKDADAKRIRSTAHSLKSSSANLGADQLAAICKELELMGKNAELEGAEAKYEALQNEYDAACVALQEEINKAPELA